MTTGERTALNSTGVEKFQWDGSSFVGITWWLQGKHTKLRVLMRELTMGSRLSNKGKCGNFRKVGIIVSGDLGEN